MTNSIFVDTNENIIFDFDKTGGFDANGQMQKIYGEEAMQNAISMWIESFKGEVLRDPRSGGYVRYYIQKSLSEEAQSGLIEAITTGFEQDFSPELELKELIVEPEFSNKAWLIRLSVRSTRFKIETVTEDRLKVRE